MSYITKDGCGTLFRNDRKTTEGQPDMTGKIMLDGKLWRLSAWHSANGRLSIKASEPDSTAGRFTPAMLDGAREIKARQEYAEMERERNGL